ncbi:MAG TPA: clostripain-related cysteine peptidase [bacterium]|nr:clostripain-related cysteine peptidase [bacterium]
MIYLDGDNDLEEYAINDFLEISSIGSNENINIVVQFDRIGGYDTRYGNWTECNRFYITTGLEPRKENSIKDWRDGIGGREVNMGDTQTLIDFINWAKTNYPAEKYALILWNHGGGWKSLSVTGFNIEKRHVLKEVCYDDTSNDYLSMREVSQALLNNYVDFIGFDACLMAMIEVANEIKNLSNVMVASEKEETTTGWNYRDFLLNLKNNPDATPEQLSFFIVNYSSQDTLSGIRLNKISELNQSLNLLLSEIMNSNDWLNVFLSREEAETYDIEFVDIYGFFENYYMHTENQQIKNYIEQFKEIFRQTIICDNNLNDASYGLSIYFPTYSSTIDQNYNENTISFPIETLWDEFLISFLNSNLFYGYETIFSEDFSSGIPEGWTIIDGYNDGYTWTTNNPKNRTSQYLTEPFMIVDSDASGYRNMNEQLITFSFNFSNYNKIFIKFSHKFWYYSDEIADFDIKIEENEWMNLKRWEEIDDEGVVVVDISDIAGGKDNVKFRWHYYNAYFDWFWAIDNVEILVKAGDIQKGDINKDGIIDIDDVIFCLRMAIGLDPVDKSVADMNEDELVDITDVIKILRKAIGLE